MSAGIYPMDLWNRIFTSIEIDAALVHNHYCLNDRRVLELFRLPPEKRSGLSTGLLSPFNLLTDRGPADWHPATEEERAVFRAARFCKGHGTTISKLAIQFSSQNPDIPTTLFSSASPETVKRNVQWHEEPVDFSLVAKVQEILAPVYNRQWVY